MKFWTACFGLYLASLIGLGGFGLPTAALAQQGTAYMTQAATGQEYDLHFGETWQSVRIFRLLTPLEAPLKVYVETRPGQRQLYTESYRAYIEDSLQLWQEALQGRMRYQYTTNRSEADITIDWVSAFPEKSIAGLTTYRVGHAEIEIKTVGVPPADIKGNILHELGHALGISGHSDNPADMMVGVRKWHREGSNYQPRLSSRDIRAIQRLYSLQWKKGEDLYATAAQGSSPALTDPQTAGQPLDSNLATEK
jgi:predicted Zn-dependent protease